MAGSSLGKYFRITNWGESHGPAIGTVVDGCPPRLELAEGDIQAELNRRRPGQSAMTTPRAEADQVQILSGVFRGRPPAHRSPCSSRAPTPSARTMMRSRTPSAPAMPTSPTRPSTVSAIRLAVAAARRASRPALLPPVPSPKNFCANNSASPSPATSSNSARS